MADNQPVKLNNDQGESLPASRFALFFAPLVVGLVVDLWTKATMFSWLFDPIGGHGRTYWLIDGIFGFQCSTNPGALFGMGSGYSWLFAIFSVVALLAIVVWLFVFRAARDRLLTFVLGLISAGILGNLYDRIGWGWQEGYPESIRYNVRDWILFQLEGVPLFDPWPNFNIADVCLVCGAVLLFVHALWLDRGTVDAGDQPIDGTVEEGPAE